MIATKSDQIHLFSYPVITDSQCVQVICKLQIYFIGELMLHIITLSGHLLHWVSVSGKYVPVEQHEAVLKFEE